METKDTYWVFRQLESIAKGVNFILFTPGMVFRKHFLGSLNLKLSCTEEAEEEVIVIFSGDRFRLERTLELDKGGFLLRGEMAGTAHGGKDELLA